MLEQAWLSEMMSPEEPSMSRISINRFFEKNLKPSLSFPLVTFLIFFLCVCVDVVRSLKSSLLVFFFNLEKFFSFFQKKKKKKKLKSLGLCVFGYKQVVDCRICGDPNSVLRFAFIEFTDEGISFH